MSYLLGFICLIVSLLIYISYLKWRKFKKRIYNNSKIEVWDYSLFIKYWIILIFFIILTLLLFFKGLINN